MLVNYARNQLWPDGHGQMVSGRKLQGSVHPFAPPLESDPEAGKLGKCLDCLGSRNCPSVSQTSAMQTPMIGTPPAHGYRVTKLLQPQSNPNECIAAIEGRKETEYAS